MAEIQSSADGFERKHIVRWSLILTCLFMSFGSMTYGASNAVISTTLGQPSFLRELGLDAEGKYASQANSLIGAANSLYYAGGFFGPFVHGWYSCRLHLMIDSLLITMLGLPMPMVVNGPSLLPV